MTPCISGCTIRSQHETACEDRDTCKGCLPRSAEFGLLCPWCWQTLNGALVDAPGLIRHLREMADAGTKSAKPDAMIRGGADPAHGSVLSDAVNAADEVHASLASWVLLILEEHPNGAEMKGPDERGAWLTQYGTVAGVKDPEATARLVRWLLPQLAWCAGQGWAGEMRREVGSMVRTTLARWPMEDVRERAIPATLCPRCDRASLTYTPPSVERAPFVVACRNPECGRVFSEDEWTRLVGLLERAS